LSRLLACTPPSTSQRTPRVSNVVIALLNQGHPLQGAASRWLAQELKHGWAAIPAIRS